jgi:hypothetical protein
MFTSGASFAVEKGEMTVHRLQVGGILRLVTPHTRQHGFGNEQTIRFRILRVTADRVIMCTVLDGVNTKRRITEDRARVEKDVREGWMIID